MSMVVARLVECDLCLLEFHPDALSDPLPCGHRYCPGCRRDLHADDPCVACCTDQAGEMDEREMKAWDSYERSKGLEEELLDDPEYHIDQEYPDEEEEYPEDIWIDDE